MPFLLVNLVLGDMGDVILKEVEYSLEGFFQTLHGRFNPLSIYFCGLH